MNVLILGSGGREHTLIWKISQSNLCSKLYIAPGNAGSSEIAQNIKLDITNFQEIADFALENNINFILPGPEAPLVAGIYDFFKANPNLQNIKIIGPSLQGAKLEGSKDFAKQFMIRHNIPTARHFSVTKSNFDEACDFLSQLKPPYVLKADGLAAGKGVLILDDFTQAKNSLNDMLNGMFGAASDCVLIEEFLAGIELSVFVLTDGNDYLILPEAKDYKRIGDGDTGLNTGGMGAVSPVPFASKELLQKVENQIVKPTIEGLKKEDIDYKGFIFLGLMNVDGNPYVIEYNVRMGDPETEAVIPRVKSDLLDLLLACADGNIKNKTIEIDPRFVTTVMMVSGGYPEEFARNKEIKITDDNNKNTLIFHAGTSIVDNKLVTSGGRVIAVSAYGNTLEEARKNSYKAVKNINFDKNYYRSDIGLDL